MSRKMVIVEDDSSILEMLRYFFVSVGFEVYTFESGEEYFDSAARPVPSIYILDIMLPQMDGFQILERLRTEKETARVPVILLTARGAEQDRITGLSSGADDYVVKPFSIMELKARVDAVLRRCDSRESLLCGDIEIREDAHQAVLRGRVLDLTNKEYELLYALVQNRGRVMSRESLLEDLWDYPYAGNTRTVDMHIKSLRAKMDEDPRNPQYIKTVHGLGYMVE